MALFRTEKPKQFTFIPRFYDERKEELEKRIGEIKKEEEEHPDSHYVPNIRGRMKSRHEALYGKTTKSGKQLINRKLMIVILIAMLFLIGYYILQILAVAGKI